MSNCLSYVCVASSSGGKVFTIATVSTLTVVTRFTSRLRKKDKAYRRGGWSVK